MDTALNPVEFTVPTWFNSPGSWGALIMQADSRIVATYATLTQAAFCPLHLCGYNSLSTSKAEFRYPSSQATLKSKMSSIKFCQEQV